MVREDEKLIRYHEQRGKDAIEMAMQARWQEAVEINKEIIAQFPADVDAYNRLGRALMELGKYQLSRGAYKKAVEYDPFNAIANRNLRRLNDMGETGAMDIDMDKVEPRKFIEEIGKAGVLTLEELAQKEKRASTVAGDKAILKISGSNLVVENSRGEYLGKVEPKPAARLIRLMLGGNKYAATVVKSAADGMTVMVREIFQDPSQVGKLSFPPKGMEEFRAYGSDKLTKIEGDEEEDESGYTIVGGDEVEVLPEENDEDEDDTGNDDE
ncbi:MAG: tetratricopeptide repeat protein [Dehalococcoidales bacterium]|nr:tetratricopeptide repeat protein [Dehalococcoidales bacterium]